MIFDLENQKLQLARSLGVCRSKENTRKDSTNANFIANLAEEQVNTAIYRIIIALSIIIVNNFQLFVLNNLSRFRVSIGKLDSYDQKGKG